MPPAETPAPPLELVVARVEDAAEGVRVFELRDPAGGELPPFTAGSHLRVVVPNGSERKYSLCNDPDERDRYVIAVKRDAGTLRNGGRQVPEILITHLHSRSVGTNRAIGWFEMKHGLASFHGHRHETAIVLQQPKAVGVVIDLRSVIHCLAQDSLPVFTGDPIHPASVCLYGSVQTHRMLQNDISGGHHAPRW